MPSFNPLDHPLLFSKPLRNVPHPPWIEHIPFAMFLVDLIRPTILVELGTHHGNSYCAFCQAIKELQLVTKAYAVNTWREDLQAGFYTEDALVDLRAHHDPLYGGFSRLVQGTSDEAVHQFSDGSIDLLHINGRHTYGAVKHDFETWLPKVSPKGVVLFHNTNVRLPDHGIWQLWEEIKSQYPSFEFLHGHGLGVLAVGREYPAALNVLLQASENTVAIRDFFSQLDHNLIVEAEVNQLAALRTEIDRLTEMNSAQVTETERVRQAYSALETEKESTIRRLKNALAQKEVHINSLTNTIDSLYQSTSWKITYPLRGAATFMRNVLSRLGFFPVSKPDKVHLQSIDPLSEKVAGPENNFSEEEDVDQEKIYVPRTRVVDRKKISVIITAFNHESYIRQCVESVLEQKGDFNLEIILGDDCSKDMTREILQAYYEKYPHIIKMLPEEDNLGVTKNLKRCLDASQGDFIAICEGDDYWTDEFKLQKQMEHLELHPDYSMCFSALMVYFEDTDTSVLNVLPEQNELTTEDLIERNYIANLSCCMYRTNVVKKLPTGIFDLYTADWMLNIACSQFGNIGFIREPMSVYRVHSQGAWSGLAVLDNLRETCHLMDVYNQFLDYRYDELFKQHKAKFEARILSLTKTAEL